MPIELRPYQKNQLDFIERKMESGLPVAIKSPTGSGKSFVILEYARRLLERHRGENFTVVIATGFNNLVYQLAEDAPLFGIKPIIWVGQGHIVSEEKIRQKYGIDDNEALTLDQFQAFSPDPEIRETPNRRCVGRRCEKEARTGHKCLYHQAKNAISSFGPKVIITNHTSYLIGLKYLTFNPDVAIIDESHVFASYYESFHTDSITPDEIKFIQNQLDNKDPTLMLFKRAINRGLMVSPQIFEQVKKKLIQNSNLKSRKIINKLATFADVKPSVDKYIEVSESVGIEITHFWSRFEVRQESIKYLLVSATQDSFTLNMFGVPKRNLYVEMNYNTIDYSQSEFLIYDDNEYLNAATKFLKRMRDEGKTRGLMLSTTNKDVNDLKALKELEGFKVFTDLNKFEEYDDGPCVLTGSRVLFQGVDIKGLDFVSLNKIPFPTYDEKFKAQIFYLENVAKVDPWKYFTIPKVENDLTQSTGRLWRRPGDKGTIAVFDDRLNNRFSYLVKSVQRERPGIKVERVYSKNSDGSNL